MPRLPELNQEDASAEIRAAMQAQVDAFGLVFNATKIMGHCPGISAASAAMGAAIDDAGHIEPSLRYLLYSKVATLNGCPF